MTVKDRVRAWLGIEERTVTPAQLFNTGGTWLDLFPTASGQVVTPQSAMQAAQGACVRLLADDISTQPFDVYVRDGRVVQEVEKPPWMVSPTGRITDLFLSYVSDWVTSLGTDGNAFTLCLPNVLAPEYLEVLPPDQVEVYTERVGDRDVVRYRVSGKAYDEMQVLHVPWVRLPGELRAVDPIQANRESIGLELAARKWAAAIFRNGGTLGGIVMVPGGPETVDADKLREQFRARHTGEQNWWKPAVLTGGATFDAATVKPAEAELAPLWTHVLEEAMRIYHIPPHLLSVIDTGAAARASVEERGIAYVRHAIRPFVTRFEMAHNLMVPGRYIKANLNALMRGDAKTRAEFYSTMLDAKVMLREEVRDLEDLPYMGDLGWLETPNNNGVPEPAEPSEDAARSETYILNGQPEVRVDSVTIGEEAARTLADAATVGIASGIDGHSERVVGHIEASTQRVVSTFAQYAAAEEQRAARLEVAMAHEPDPPPSRYVRERDELGRPTLVDTVYANGRVFRQRVTRDETGHVISMVAA